MNGIQEALDFSFECFNLALSRSFECLREENQSIVQRQAKTVEIKNFLDEDAKIRNQFILPINARSQGKGTNTIYLDISGSYSIRGSF